MVEMASLDPDRLRDQIGQEMAGREFAAAAALLTRLLVAESQNANTLNDLADALEHSGEIEESLVVRHRLARLDPGHPGGSSRIPALETELAGLARSLDQMVANRRDGGAVPIYVKCHSRPAYLDRCLRSLAAHVTGGGSVTVLNDGIGEPFLGKLKADHPGVVFRASPKLLAGVVVSPCPYGDEAGMQRMVRAWDDFERDPAVFWTAEIGLNPCHHCLIIEEDCWVQRPVDLTGFTGPDTWDIMSAQLFSHQRSSPDAGSTHCLDLRRALVRRPNTGLSGMICPANAIIQTDYFVYQNSHKMRWSREHALVKRAVQFRQGCLKRGIAFGTAYAAEQVICHSEHSTTRIDGGGPWVKTQIPHSLYNDAISLCWFQGDLDPMEGFPGDFPVERIAGIFDRILGGDALAAWRRWQDEFLAVYHNALS